MDNLRTKTIKQVYKLKNNLKKYLTTPTTCDIIGMKSGVVFFYAHNIDKD